MNILEKIIKAFLIIIDKEKNTLLKINNYIYYIMEIEQMFVGEKIVWKARSLARQ